MAIWLQPFNFKHINPHPQPHRGMMSHHHFPTQLFFFFLVVLVFELRTLCMLGRLSLPLEAITSLFLCFSYFSNRVLSFCPGRASSTILCLLWSWGDRYVIPHPACLLRWGLTNFLSRLALNHSPHDLAVYLGLEAWAIMSSYPYPAFLSLRILGTVSLGLKIYFTSRVYYSTYYLTQQP
jgi:hypothetical protein